jgi:hypothetical protein
MKKLSLVFVPALCISLMGCSMLGIKHLRFESYDNAGQLSRALNQLHPNGSPIADVQETLIRAGAKCHPQRRDELPPREREEAMRIRHLREYYSNPPYIIPCTYTHSVGFGVVRKWEVVLVLKADGTFRGASADFSVVGL